MSRTKRALIGTVVFLGLVGGLFFAEYTRAQSPTPTAPDRRFEPRSLVGASSEEVARYAIAYTNALFPSPSGKTPVVRLVRSITGAELPSLDLGVGGTDRAYDGRRFWLVILQGEFNVSSLGRGPIKGDGPWPPAPYIGFTFDVDLGVASLILPSDGSAFRTVLNDPSLPERVRATPTGGTPIPLPPRDPRVGLPSAGQVTPTGGTPIPYPPSSGGR